MKVGIALEIDSSVNHLADPVASIDLRLERFFEGRSYGSDIENIFVGMILIGPDPGGFHPVRSLKYRKLITIRRPPLAGGPIIKKNVVSFDVLPNFNAVSRMSMNEAEVYLSSVLVSSFDILRTGGKKFPDFDVEAFLADVEACLSSK